MIQTAALKYENKTDNIKFVELNKKELLEFETQIVEMFFEILNQSFENEKITKSFAKTKYETVLKNSFSQTQNLNTIFLAAIKNNFQNKQPYLAGFIVAYQQTYIAEQAMHIAYLYVHEKNRNLGIGKKLVEKIEHIAFKRKIEKINCNVGAKNQALEFYKKMNFKINTLHLGKNIIHPLQQ